MFSLHLIGEVAEFNGQPIFSKVPQMWYLRRGVLGSKYPDIFWYSKPSKAGERKGKQCHIVSSHASPVQNGL